MWIWGGDSQPEELRGLEARGGSAAVRERLRDGRGGWKGSALLCGKRFASTEKIEVRHALQDQQGLKIFLLSTPKMFSFFLEP